jgi:chromosome partitioning protein
VINQTPIRGQRIANAATALGDGVGSALAQPFIVMRNDHQDALGMGLAVGEYAPFGKSADEIRSLWQWVAAKLNGDVHASESVAADESLDAAELDAALFLPAPLAPAMIASAI